MENNMNKDVGSVDLRGEKFVALYDAYVERIYRFVYYKTHHKETAEDLTSKTFIKAFDNMASFDESKGTFSNWIYSIARNNVIDYYRMKKNESSIEDVWDLSSDEDIERDVDARRKLEKVEKYLKNLKSEQRDIIMMRVWQDMPYKEIADIMGKSEASCKMTFSRSMKELRLEMGMSLFLYFMLLKL